VHEPIEGKARVDLGDANPLTPSRVLLDNKVRSPGAEALRKEGDGLGVLRVHPLAE
jgi:hypothetical protein